MDGSNSPPPPSPPPFQRCSSDEMIAKFSQSFQRRAKSRVSLYTPTLTSDCQWQHPPKHERTLLPPEMEGKLLVPNVKLKVHCSSCATSLSSASSSSWSGPTSLAASSLSSTLCTTSKEGLVYQSHTDSASSPTGCSKRATFECEPQLPSNLLVIFNITVTCQHGHVTQGLGHTKISRHTLLCNCHQRKLRKFGRRLSMVKNEKLKSRSKWWKSENDSSYLLLLCQCTCRNNFFFFMYCCSTNFQSIRHFHAFFFLTPDL